MLRGLCHDHCIKFFTRAYSHVTRVVQRRDSLPDCRLVPFDLHGLCIQQHLEFQIFRLKGFGDQTTQWLQLISGTFKMVIIFLLAI